MQNNVQTTKIRFFLIQNAIFESLFFFLLMMNLLLLFSFALLSKSLFMVCFYIHFLTNDDKFLKKKCYLCISKIYCTFEGYTL